MQPKRALGGGAMSLAWSTMSANLKAWERRVVAMQRCSGVADLLAQFGQPHHKVQQAGFEIWHYPLGVASRMLYSVHVSVRPDQSCQAFLFFEPTELGDSPEARKWWQYWKHRVRRRGLTTRSRTRQDPIIRLEQHHRKKNH